MKRLIKAAVFAWIAKKLFDRAQRRNERDRLAPRPADDHARP
jgi:hypothetical protein